MVKLHDLEFEPYLDQNTLQQSVKELAERISADYTAKTPVFLGILNGAFMFLSDLMKYYEGDCEISFTKLASYEGISSSGEVSTLLGAGNLRGRDVIVVEDIVDTGNTLEHIVDVLKNEGVASYRIASLFLKPEAYKKTFPVDYVGIEIPNKFIVGYGLDYNGLGRNIPEIYQLKSNSND
ncbi:hypoxanthine phosphoribosyltransferase [Psychroflexus sediminis]|uniref:Hypoxanthine phosphoribosyltransferase n=1 Tax=Psychroflexus sediminis TaxID=470826 RepID=A0A1G7V6Q3_9FLAO|nr:hypoxanthine phosphoribosyltransferase [Psychroflexus sediminis]SDG55446.1 hypoxanthine phosphoribosyltransferase [Psychroflexus sediminis]